jgi:hypothetical protein
LPGKNVTTSRIDENIEIFDIAKPVEVIFELFWRYFVAEP